MAKKPKLAVVDSDIPAKTPVEDENWASKPDSDIYLSCLKLYDKIYKAYENREEADDMINEYWNIYQAIPDDNAAYTGNSKVYVPVVRDCINARAKRALKQLFPQKYLHIDAIAEDGNKPHEQLALLEHYVKTTKLKSTVRSMLISGDVTGQWNCYIDWVKNKRWITEALHKGRELEGLDLEEPFEEEVEEEKEIIEEGPVIVDFATSDLAVIPPTCDDIDKAEAVSLRLRLTKEAVKDYVDAGIFVLPDGSDISEWIDEKKRDERTNPSKDRTSDAGIKSEGTNKYALIYWVTARIEFEKGKKQLAYIYFASERDIIGIIKAPQWGQKRPIISAPVDKVQGSFFGISKVEAVKFMQWNLNDYWNMGQDSAQYALLPIVMTDPEKNPNYQSMVMGLAAVWAADPASTSFHQFPPLWKDSLGLCEAIKYQIQESLDVNPMMMGRMPQGRKNANMMGAQMQEQSTAIMDMAERFEEVIMNPLIELMFEYDCQFRTRDLLALQYGELGYEASIQVIPPQQWGQRIFFQWAGTEYMMNMQRMQQQIATMNVLRGIPPQQLNGKRIDITPIVEQLVDNVFGANLSRLILIDDRNKFTVPATVEDEMMVNGMMAKVHEYDNDIEHIQQHQQAAQMTGDPAGMIRGHIMEHMKQMMQKRQQQMGQQQQMQGGMPGVPGGGQQPGVPGSPRPGAQTQGPKLMQNPNGSIHSDQMAGGMPRG